jgi:Xaa-Pro aminopeptidase
MIKMIEFHKEKAEKVIETLKSGGADALLLFPGADIGYYTGFSIGLSERLAAALIPSDGKPVLVVNKLEGELRGQKTWIEDVDVWLEHEDPVETLAQNIERLGLQELDWMRMACAITDRALEAGFEQLHTGGPPCPMDSPATGSWSWGTRSLWMWEPLSGVITRTSPGLFSTASRPTARGRSTEDAGYGEYFIHRLGHGIGLQGHERPYIVRNNGLELEPGMTFTIEPGIYIVGEIGVRVEDTVVCTTAGCESLTRLSRELKSYPVRD